MTRVKFKCKVYYYILDLFFCLYQPDMEDNAREAGMSS